jgi:hypothetical protein
LRRPGKASEVMAEIRAKMNLVSVSVQDVNKGYTSKGFDKDIKRPTSVDKRPTKYLSKLEKGEFTKFSTLDIMYFFRDTANNNGHKYVIANQQKDMHIFKLLIAKGYEIQDILAMIEFLFTSEQDYLNKDNIQPTVLVSTWCNTIYSDTKLWLDDEYKTKKTLKHSKREWGKTLDDKEIKIDEWGF